MFTLALLLSAIAPARAAMQPETLEVLDAARFVVSPSQFPPDIAGTPVSLPDPWDVTRPEFTGPAWYLIDWRLDEEPQQTLALYLTATTLPAEVFVNGTSVGSTGTLAGRRPSSWEEAIAIVLPSSLVRSGVNRIAIRTYSARPGVGGFGPVLAGPEAAIRTRAHMDLMKYIVGPAIVSLTIIVIGLFIIVLWVRRRDPIYALFGVAAVIWGLHTAVSLLPTPLLPQPHWAIWWHVVYMTFVGLLCLFCVSFAGVGWRRFRMFVIAFMLALVPVLYAASALHRLLETTIALRAIAIAMVVVALAAVARYAMAMRNTESVLLFAAGAISTALAIHDFVIAEDPYEIRPLWLVPYASLAFLTLVGWILVDRFVRALNESERLNVQLEERVAEKSAALSLQLARTEEARDEAQAANRGKSRFLAAASHDLRQPLHALGLFAGALDEHISDPEGSALIRKITTTVASLDTLLSALLDVSKLDAGAIVPRVRPMPLDPLFERIANDFAPEAIERRLKFAAVPTRLAVASDPVLLERILRNLVANALRYTERGGIVIGCRRRGELVCVEVRDTGPGIPVPEQEKIFEEFYQIGNPERDRARGLGLGLAIVRRLCGLLGHRIDVWSKPGQGSAFRVWMERAHALAPVETPPDDRPATPLEHRSVVVIDDEAAIREGMRDLLESWGCKALIAADIDEAITLGRGGPRPDALLVDYRLRGGMDGVRAIELLRAEWGHGIPAVLVSGASSPEDLARIKASGLVLLHKPVMPAKLRSVLSYVLARDANAAAPQP